MFNNFKKATAKVNGIKIHYRIAGNGPPVLLFMDILKLILCGEK